MTGINNRQHIMKKVVLIGFLCALILSCKEKTAAPQHAAKSGPQLIHPEDYGPLFAEIQSTKGLFPSDGNKLFVDSEPKFDLETIQKHYAALTSKDTATLRRFIAENFIVPGSSSHFVADSTEIMGHIEHMWQVLQRPADVKKTGTLIPLPKPYIVPGGRFREIYYWDSYFTMLGLQADKQTDIIRNMVDNFSWLIDTIGFIPNGNRTYYRTRSQPPFYACMVGILAEVEGDTVYAKYLNPLLKEYSFWMDGRKQLTAQNPTHRRVVRMPDGSLLNRYWDDSDTPRPESYIYDVETVALAKEKNPGVDGKVIQRHLRAGAESGWDFSSRWLVEENGKFPLYTIHTTDIIPVDLNSLLYNLEMTIAKAFTAKKDPAQAEEYRQKAEQRQKALLQYCWNQADGYFMDYDFVAQKQTGIFSLAGVFPLAFKLATPAQAERAAQKIAKDFLKGYGVATTLYTTGQQWDAPNGWAPLQWMTIKGLRNYNQSDLANDIKKRWLSVNRAVYDKKFRMLEKYNVVNPGDGGGGEYPNQDGFGWTNGVYQKLAKEKNNLSD